METNDDNHHWWALVRVRVFFSMFSMLSNIIHERIQCALSRCVLKKSLYHKYCNWKVSFFHELLLCAHSFSCKTFLTNVKLEIKMASFLHELMLYDCSNLSFFVNLASQTSHLKSFITSWCLVSIQVSFSWKIGITNITLEIFRSWSVAMHTTYSWNIKWQKCAGMGLNGFIYKKIKLKY